MKAGYLFIFVFQLIICSIFAIKSENDKKVIEVFEKAHSPVTNDETLIGYDGNDDQQTENFEEIKVEHVQQSPSNYVNREIQNGNSKTFIRNWENFNLHYPYINIRRDLGSSEANYRIVPYFIRTPFHHNEPTKVQDQSSSEEIKNNDASVNKDNNDDNDDVHYDSAPVDDVHNYSAPVDDDHRDSAPVDDNHRDSTRLDDVNRDSAPVDDDHRDQIHYDDEIIYIDLDITPYLSSYSEKQYENKAAPTTLPLLAAATSENSNDNNNWGELKLLGSTEQCGPGRQRDEYGICHIIDNN